MSNTAPENYDEYLKRFQENQRVDGYGIGNVFTHAPCPFCAAPDFMVYEVLDVARVLSKGATCQECGRSARAIFQESPDTISFEIVQTGGPDQPEWLNPKMRRVE